MKIAARLEAFIDQVGLGEVYTDPLDVRLQENTVVQPDVLVILKAHLDRLTDTGVTGAPDLVVEVASPATATYDRREKYDAYVRAGVPEYWLVDPATRTVEVRVLEGQTYALLGLFKDGDNMRSQIIPQIRAIAVATFFATTQ